jgi:type III secretion protein K
MDLMRLAMRQQLHPELDMHPSWLPARWPAKYRGVRRLNESGQAMVSEWVRRELGGDVPTFDTPLRRLALVDAPSLRRMAAYIGLAAHKPLLQARGTGRQLRRQAERIEPGAADFIVRRVPALSEFAMNTASLQERPIAVGRVVLNRGYRLLLGTLAADGDALVRRVRLKLPRHACATPPALAPRQHQQLEELMLMCIVPERLPQWDWLF